LLSDGVLFVISDDSTIDPYSCFLSNIEAKEKQCVQNAAVSK